LWQLAVYSLFLGSIDPGCPCRFVKGTIMPKTSRILIVDDDPLHLDIYGMIVRRAGFEPVPVLVRFSGLDPIPDSKIDLVLLDYRMNSVKTAPEIAQEIRSAYPDAPIILLSDLWSPPSDVAPFIHQFVRKGEHAKLMEALYSHLPASDSAVSPARPED
jgi:CheY-like chemotaxis protein